MMPNRGYDMTPTMYSPDGRIYQVEYALETVKRGTLAIGIKAKDGVIIAVEEKSRALQVSEITQKIFQIDDHIAAAAAGYIPDARVQVDNARYFSQSNKLTYDEPVEIETVAKHIADQNHQFTQYSGVRPYGVALIIAGVDKNGSNVFIIDPSGTFVSYAAVAIGLGADDVNSFLEKNYKEDMSMEEAASLAIAGINLKNEKHEGVEHIKMSQVRENSKTTERVSLDNLKKFDQAAKGKFVK